MNETQVHQAFSKWLNKERLPFLHSRTDRRTSMTLGDPDYCVALAGRCIFLEIKVGKNKLSLVQETRIAYLRRAGNRVEVVYGLEAAIEAVRAWAGIVDESKRYLEHDWDGLKQAVAAVGEDGHVPGDGTGFAGAGTQPPQGQAERNGQASPSLYLKDWQGQPWVCQTSEKGPDLLLHRADQHDLVTVPRR